MEDISIIGICPSRTIAERTVENLKMAGFLNTDISVLFSSAGTSKEFAHENSTKAPEGAATGTLSGAALGGVLGWLAGIGALAIPGVGPFIAAGPIMATLAGAGVGGALGGITGALVGLGLPEYEAKQYESRVNTGGILIAVHCDDDEDADRAREILRSSGVEDISKKSGSDNDTGRSTSSARY